MKEFRQNCPLREAGGVGYNIGHRAQGTEDVGDRTNLKGNETESTKMAERLLKAKKRKVGTPRAVKDEEPKKIVLVGTYKEKQLAWIKKNKVYNYPVKDGDGFDAESFAKIKELWLYADAKGRRYCFSAEFVKKMTQAEFVASYPTYAKLGKARSKAYYVFNTSFLEYGPKLDDPEVLIRAMDFATGRGRARLVKKAFDRYKADGEFAPLATYLPSELSQVPRERLRVCEAAVQMDASSLAFDNSSALPLGSFTVFDSDKREIVPESISALKLDLFLDRIICGDSAQVLKELPDNSIDLVVTSPPYDQIRDYNGFTLDLHAIGQQLYRVVKDGGIVAMVIQDSTKNFAKTLTSFRTIVDWCDNVGFKMFETVIYHKNGTEGAWWTHRFRVDHEYMPIFFKGDRPQYFNKDPLKIPSKWGGKVMTGSGNRRTSGETTHTVTRPINLMKCRGTVWDYMMAGDKNPLKRRHPAVFPDRIPYDFIRCFCPEGGIVLDPFIGCGSTAVTAKGLGRRYIGIDISAEYCALAEERIKKDFVKYSQMTLNI